MKQSKTIIQLKDNTHSQYIECPENCSEELLFLSSQTIENLKDDNGCRILIFPHSFQNYGDGIDKQVLFSVNTRLLNGKNQVESIDTGNMMGFIGINGIELSITSRFSDGVTDDYFLMYMLQKVLSINVVKLQYGISQEKMFELLVFLLPAFLRRAMRQGLFRQYIRKHYNNSNVRGIIDFNQHFKHNVPSNYKIAYLTREFDADNQIMQLIRHTIEYVRGKRAFRHLLSIDKDTDRWVKNIVDLTPSYNVRLREQVIKANLQPLIHPYYTEYSALQKLCLRILKSEKSTYGISDNKIYGIIFDGAWLWEEYLATILSPMGFIHPKNKTGEGRIYLSEDNRYPRYPDFYMIQNHTIVLDAKYKRNFDSRNDINQLLTYMFRFCSSFGAFVLPGNNSDEIYSATRLLGYGGTQGLFRIPIPLQKDTSNFAEYKNLMEISEQIFKKRLHMILKICNH